MICLARIKRNAVTGGTSNTRLWIGRHNMSECGVRRRKCEPHGDVDVRGQRDVAQRIERYSRDRVWNHYRGRDGLYAEQTNHDHSDPALAVVKCVYWHMYHQNRRCTVKNMWKGGLTSDHEDYISRNCRKYDGDKLEEKDGFAGVQRDGNFAPELGSHSLYCSGRENLARERKRGEGGGH